MHRESFNDLLCGSSEEGRQRSAVVADAMGRGLWLLREENREIFLPGLAIPERLSAAPSGGQRRPTPMDFMEALASLDTYVEPSEMPGGSPGAVAREIVASQNPRVLLAHLSVLVRLTSQPRDIRRLVAGFTDALSEDLQRPFEQVMRGGFEDGGEPHLVSRQGALAAARAVFESGDWSTEDLPTPSITVAILLVHAVSSELSELRRNTGRFIGDIPADLMMEIVRAGLFNEADNSTSVMDRTLRVWQELAEDPLRTPLRAAPRELLAEALGGVSFEDFFAIGVRLWSHAIGRDPLRAESQLTLNPADLNHALEGWIVEEFLGRVSAEPGWFTRRFADRASSYDFLAFQERPVLKLGGELLVLDETYLLEKFTMPGLFWTVHDNERDHHERLDREHWNQAHGEFVEKLVNERLKEMAPLDRGRGSGDSFYSEDEMKSAYPGSKVADGAVDYGDYFLIVETTGGQPVLGTRVGGDPEKFEADTEKLVFDEAEQLHKACRSLLADQKKLTGYDPPQNRKIVPVLVVGGGYPADALSRWHVDEVLEQKGWLQDEAIEPLCILDPTEIEILETLRQSRKNPGWILAAWKRSGLRNVSFKNYVVKEVDPELSIPLRQRRNVTQAFGDVTQRLTGQELPEGYVADTLRSLE